MNRDQMVEALQGLTPDVQIRQHQLVKGRFYHGEGRFVGNLALWDGEFFHGFQAKFGEYMETRSCYGDTGFTPISEIATPEELK